MVIGFVAAVVIAGPIVRSLTATTLGTATPPFSMSWAPVLRWPVLVGMVVAVALVTAAPWAIDRVRSPAAFAALSYLATLALGLAVNVARRGTDGWSHVFQLGPHGSYEARFEYLGGLPLLRHGTAGYVRHFASELPYLPTHAKGNPPGPLIAMHLLGITTAGRLAAACIVVGAACGPLAYALGRELGGERRGRIAAAMTMCSPAVVLLGVTSADYAFAALGAAAAWLLVSRRPAGRAAGCALVALASFFSWVLLAIPVWAAVCVLRRDGPRQAATVAGCAALAILAFTLVLHAAWGYDPVAVVDALRPIYAHGIASRRPYAFWVFGSPAAWLAMLGAPIAWLAARSLARGDPAAVALATVVVVSAVAGFTKAETERIWLPYVPLACVAAAAVSPTRLRLLLATLAGQAIVLEVLFQTVW